MRCVAFNFTLPPDEKLVLPPIIPFAGNRHMDLLFAEYDRELFLSGQENSLKCQGIFLWILSDMLKEPCHHNAHVRRMKEYIADNLSDKLSVAEIAAHVGLHPAYCGALFKREEGCTLLNYTQTRKIEQATRLLRDDALPIGVIAELLGFEDIYYFSRVYKQVMGHSPLAQRRMWQSSNRKSGDAH